MTPPCWKPSTKWPPQGYAVELAELLPQVLPAGCGRRYADGRRCPPAGPHRQFAGRHSALPAGGRCRAPAWPPPTAWPRTGNVSAGTSIFAMVVLEKPPEQSLPRNRHGHDPRGEPVAMVHCNNCTSDLNAWVELLAQSAGSRGKSQQGNELFTKLFNAFLAGRTGLRRRDPR